MVVMLLAPTTGDPNSDDSQCQTKMCLSTCRTKYPELLDRANHELRPWLDDGITPSMLDQTWLCNNSANKSKRRLNGVLVSIRDGIPKYEFSGSESRGSKVMQMIDAVASDFNLPDVDFVMITSDHLWQTFGDRPYSGSFDASTAPILVPYRLQKDTCSVAAPDWTFFSLSDVSQNHTAGIDKKSSEIYAIAKDIPWETKVPKLFFMGDAARGSTRERAWVLSIKDQVPLEQKWGAIGIGPPNRYARVVSKLGLVDFTLDPESQFKSTSHSDHCRYRYVLNLCGNAGSNRFKVRKASLLVSFFLVSIIAFFKNPNQCHLCCMYIYFLLLLQYLFFCDSVVVSPLRNGGFGASEGNEFEEFWHHRLEPNVTFVQPSSIDALAETVKAFRNDDAVARRIAAAGLAWAKRELTQEAAWCYWAHLIDLLAALELKGGGPKFTPQVYDSSLSKHPHHFGTCLNEPSFGSS